MHKPQNHRWSSIRDTICLLFGISALGILVTPFAVAQGSAGDNKKAEQLLDHIIVTARRKEESILDVPLAVTSFDSKEIDESGMIDFNDLFLLAPGVFNSSSGGRSDRVTIRGFSQISTSGGSNAGIFIDGIFVNGPVSALDMTTVERIEVIKGPQSAQYGRGTLSGAVNYITRRPGNEFDAQIRATVASLDETAISAHVSGPLSDTLGGNLAVSYLDKDSEFFNQFSQREDMGGKNWTNFSGGLLFEPSETLSFYLRGSYSDISNDPTGIQTQGPEANNCNLDTTRQYYCGTIVIDYNDIRNITVDDSYVGGEAGTDRESTRLALIVDWDVSDNGSLQSITGWQNEDERWGSDATNRGVVSSPLLPNGSAVDISREWTDISQELRYRHSFGDNVETLIGAYYFESERDEIATYIPDDRGTFTQESRALFGSVEFAFTDNLHLTAEVRYQEEDIELDDPDSDLFVESSFDATLPRITLDWEPTDNMMLYFVYAQGNKPGSVNTRLLASLDPALIPIDEEENEMFEIGAKGVLLDGRISYQLAAYTFTWENQQLTQQYVNPDTNAVVTYTGNIGETDIIGFEADLGFELMPNFWNVRFTAAYNDAEIQTALVDGRNVRGRLSSDEQEAAAFGFPVTTEADGNLFVTVSGTPAPASPELTFSLTSAMGAPLTGTSYNWFARLDYSWIDEQYASIFGQAKTDSRENLNLRVGVENDRYRLEFWGTNLTDDETPLALVRTVRFDGGFRPPAPSPVQRSFSALLPEGVQYGITATVKF